MAKKIRPIDRVVGVGGATGLNAIPKKGKHSKLVQEEIEGSIAGDVLSDTSDITSGDYVTGADTTAYPTVVDEEGNITNAGPRQDVGERIPPVKKK